MNDFKNDTVKCLPDKDLVDNVITTGASVQTEIEWLREENEKLKAKLEEYLLKECMSRVDSLTYSTSKKTIELYLDEGNPIKVLVECFQYSNDEKVKELYDTYGFDMIIKAIRSLFVKDDKEEEDE